MHQVIKTFGTPMARERAWGLMQCHHKTQKLGSPNNLHQIEYSVERLRK